MQKMRIIAGEKKGTRLFEITRIRPTGDKVREAIFDILSSAVEGASVLDLFAGTGAMGLEALSRGAAYVVFVENARTVAATLRRNVEKLDYQERSHIITASASSIDRFLQKEDRQYNLIFMDPPYRQTLKIVPGRKVYELIKALSDAEAILPEALLVLEHKKDAQVPRKIAAFRMQDRRRYGDTEISIFVKMPLEKSAIENLSQGQ
jgi:16S rRNA (guanine(966)-N(2))-methyltransferase RsmD